jgi:hypothetical protein
MNSTPTPAPSQDSSADATLRKKMRDVVTRAAMKNMTIPQAKVFALEVELYTDEYVQALTAQKVREALETERTATLGLSNDMKIKRSLYLAEENGYKRCMEDMKRKAQLTPPSAESETEI